MFLNEYSIVELIWIALSLLLLGMSKGGFPAGTISLPILILIWPDQATSARDTVAFLLPVLCTMDIVSFLIYKKDVLWDRILPLFPGSLLGIVVASLLFVAEEGALIAIPERWLKFSIGMVGVLFLTYQAGKKWILRRLEKMDMPGFGVCSLFGVCVGVASTIAHAAGPIFRMYLLPQGVAKMNFVASGVAFFLVVNLAKVPAFALAGRFSTDKMLLGLCMLPVIPLGVGLGYILVRRIKEKYYIGLIYATLLITSLTLIVKGLTS